VTGLATSSGGSYPTNPSFESVSISRTTNQLLLGNTTVNAPATSPITVTLPDTKQNSTILTNGIVSTLTNFSTRPPILGGTALNDFEIRGFSTALNSEAGFLRLRAGGGEYLTNATCIDLSGTSWDSDMNNNIVFYTSGAERMRINSSGVYVNGTKIPQTIPSGGGSIQCATLWHSTSNNVAGGNFTSGAWQTRPLNTANSQNNITGMTLDTVESTFRLPVGTYMINARAQGYRCGSHRIRLLDYSLNTEVAAGSNANSNTGTTGCPTDSFLSTIYSFEYLPTSFRLEHRCATTKTVDGMGFPCNFGSNEIYASVQIIKLS
jgi:hypothetical protein